jgi:glycosyltransferase involved in cell wall biosynthesis
LVWTHHSVDRRRLPHRTAFYRLFSRLARCHAFASEAVRSFQHSRAGTAPWEEVIHNGIELAPYLAVEPQAGPAFGALGRLVPEKGFDVLIRAFGRLAREDRHVRLTIGGAGPARPALEQLMRAEGLSGRLQFAGFVHNVPAFLAGVNVFVLPSRWEAFGIALLEAMAAGLPCIASRVGGMPEVGGDLVRWVEPDDVDGLYRAMRELCGVPQPPLRIARQREAAARFSQDSMAESYLRVYRSMVR